MIEKEKIVIICIAIDIKRLSFSIGFCYKQIAIKFKKTIQTAIKNNKEQEVKNLRGKNSNVKEMIRKRLVIVNLSNIKNEESQRR